MQPSKVFLTSKVNVCSHVSFHIMDNEAVLLNLKTGKYFGLNEIGTRMWNLIAEHNSLEPVLKVLISEYEVSEDQLQKDLLTLVDRLAGHELLIVSND